MDIMTGSFGLAEGWDPASVLTAINSALLTGVCITDATGHFVSVSNGWCSIYGYTPEQVLGKHFTIVVPPEMREAATRLHDDFIESGIEIPGEWQVLRPDGQPLWIRVGAARFFDRTGRPFKVTTVEDITARKSAEKALADSHARLEQMNRDKDRLFSIIGHDLKGPFTPIVGYADLMENLGDALTVHQALGYAHRIQEAAGHALSLLDNLLDWARMQVEARPQTPTVQPIAPMVDEAMTMLASIAERKSIALVSEVSPDLQARVDAYMLTTVVRNLLSNALKFTPPGGQVSISGDAADDLVTLQVVDTGVGMPPETLHEILSHGDTISTPGTHDEPGTGLGLRVCRDILDRMDGALSATSTPGEGSTFVIRLPSPPAFSDDR